MTLMWAGVRLLSDSRSQLLDTYTLRPLTLMWARVRLLSDGRSQLLDTYTLRPHDSHAV